MPQQPRGDYLIAFALPEKAEQGDGAVKKR